MINRFDLKTLKGKLIAAALIVLIVVILWFINGFPFRLTLRATETLKINSKKAPLSIQELDDHLMRLNYMINNPGCNQLQSIDCYYYFNKDKGVIIGKGAVEIEVRVKGDPSRVVIEEIRTRGEGI